jgi:hypothetical protein
MNRVGAYGALANELEAYRELPQPTLVALVGSKVVSKVVVLDGEELQLEIQTVWASPKRSAVRITAIAYGPSHLRTERLEECLTIPLDDLGSFVRRKDWGRPKEDVR